MKQASDRPMTGSTALVTGATGGIEHSDRDGTDRSNDDCADPGRTGEGEGTNRCGEDSPHNLWRALPLACTSDPDPDPDDSECDQKWDCTFQYGFHAYPVALRASHRPAIAVDTVASVITPD